MAAPPASSSLRARLTRGGWHSPSIAALLTVLLAVVGVTGSVYSEAIGGACPFSLGACWTPGGRFSLAASTFWVALFCTGGLFLVRQLRVDERRDGVNSELRDSVHAVGSAVAAVEKSAETLHKAVRTMPPYWFLWTFDDVYRRCEAEVWAACASPGGANRAAVIEGVRVVLQGFLRLLREYEGRAWGTGEERRRGAEGAHPVRYAANVMVYIPVEDIPVADREVLRSRLWFWDGKDEELRGVLDLRTELSAASDEEQEDTTLMSFCLPIPIVPKPKIREERAPWRTIPGAPMAFVTQEPANFRNTPALAEWSKMHGDFHEWVREDLDGYFGSRWGRRVQSFVAHPIARHAYPREPPARSPPNDGPPPNTTVPPIGVLNLHADMADLLDGDLGKDFYAVTYPLRLLLLRLLEHLRGLNEVCEAGKWQTARPAPASIALKTPAPKEPPGGREG